MTVVRAVHSSHRVAFARRFPIAGARRAKLKIKSRMRTSATSNEVARTVVELDGRPPLKEQDQGSAC
jgi:hypothetical protein